MTPILYNPPIVRDAWLIWGSVHQTDHFQIVAGIREKLGLTVGVLPIDPVPLDLPSAMLTWFMNHQAIHNEMNAAFGLGGLDLSYVDFSNKEQMATWIQYNALEHQQVSFAIASYQPPPQATQQIVSQPIWPQPVGSQPLAQPSGNQAILPQGVPGVETILPQPQPGTQVLPQGGSPQAPLQPFPTVQPQPSAAPPPGIQPGTPILPGNPGAT